MSYMTPSLALLGFGLTEMVLVFLIIILLFGAKKLPMLARGLGQGVRNFKGELNAPPDSKDKPDSED